MAARSQSTTPRPARKRAASAPETELAKTRARLDRKRAKRRQKMLWAHYWLLCPKCGGDMFVQRTAGIAFEVCRDCHGIAIDGDEMALLLAQGDPERTLRAILRQSRTPDTTEI
jgi:Zn-finger nucleic acid-binding protein